MMDGEGFLSHTKTPIQASPLSLFTTHYPPLTRFPANAHESLSGCLLILVGGIIYCFRIQHSIAVPTSKQHGTFGEFAGDSLQ